MAQRDLRVVSKVLWGTTAKNGHPTDEEILSGCQQRIADALEAHAKQGARSLEIMEKGLVNQERLVVVYEAATKDRVDLINRNVALGKTNILLQDEVKKAYAARDEFKRTLAIQRDGVKYLQRRIRALKGVITRMKRSK